MVKPATTALPDTSAGAHSVEWQYAQIPVGGWRSSPHAEHRWKRSTPSAPDVQKNSFVSLICGRSRPVASTTLAPRPGCDGNLLSGSASGFRVARPQGDA